MATRPQAPALFLSHSGEQKGFVWSLYRQLRDVNHSPFFDKDSRPDSLPKGSPFPSRILDACRACKLAIVVVSHEYIESMWPMFELQQLLFHNPSSPNNVFPIFYKLKPGDLCKPENLARWKSVWDRRAPVWNERNRDWHMATPTTFESLTLDPNLWPKALEMLRYQNGRIRPENKDDHTFIQTIVTDICKMHPPPGFFLMGSHFKGAEHIQQEVHERFQQQEQQRDLATGDAYKRRPISVGLYGVGGSGKTTVCQYMLNFYNEEYLGRCCFLQFSSKKEDDGQLLVQSMKDILSKHGNLTMGMFGTKSVNEAMHHVQEFLRQYRVFLVLDNVWDWDLLVAKQIVTMDYMPESKLLVTARSEALLRALSADGTLMQIVHVPSMSEEEATEALMAYSLTSSQHSSNGEDLRSLTRSCFFGEQCHPLLLKAVGAKLRHRGGRTRSTEDFAKLCSSLKKLVKDGGGEIEDTVVSVLKTSYDALDSTVQDIFLKLGTCVPKKYTPWDAGNQYDASLEGSSEWLSMLSTASSSQTTDDIRDQLIELEYHGLLQNYKEEDVVIHDVQMMLIQSIVRNNNGEPGCFFFQGDVATLSASQLSRLKYIHGHAYKSGVSFDQRGTSPNVSGIEVLHLHLGYSGKLSVQHMQSLRHLMLSGSKMEVGGWHGAPNLVSVCLRSYKGGLRIQSSMTCLQRLERLDIIGNRCNISDNYLGLPSNLQKLYISGYISADMGALSACSSLRELRVYDNLRLHKLSVSNWINLRSLMLCGCNRLQAIEGSSVCGLGTALEKLSLIDCSSLESIPDLKEAGNLTILEVQNCEALREVKVGDAALTRLEHLSLMFGRCNLVLSAPPCSPTPLAAFRNLRSLCAFGEGRGSTGSLEVVDVGSSNLPVSLEDLELTEFTGAKEMIGLSTLVNLQRLSINDWPSLTRVTGLGALTKLASLNISFCESLEQVGHWADPFDTYELTNVDVFRCPSLQTLSTLRLLPSLAHVHIKSSPNVQEVMLPECASKCLHKNYYNTITRSWPKWSGRVWG